MDSDTSHQQDSNGSETVKTPMANVQNNKPSHQNSEMFLVIKKATAWVMIISAMLFALVGVLAVWEVFGPHAGDVVWRAFSSLVIIAFAALVVNVASRMVTGKQ